ncbi:flagellar filament capping protein FliD [Brevibacillus sp. SYP-B805]|uniref:flagellar filament capping protein FliD n=1 Tax=Brevibacillus sp. SYP-B805 TaxID=1578199 RepID=UPI0013EB656D|nr:flagellar filament capping protein FliD [Brevibacillus sp. SYP-B805]NGQ95641.1 flagellar filament capping protein FliD [Brevibacillus sp. SYP-B805]
MPVRITGLGSGLDIDSLVKQQMQIKRIPIDTKKQKLTWLTWQRDAYRDMNTQVSSFLTEARKLTLESTFLAKTASLSTDDAQKVTVKPNPSAVNGNFTLQVKQIAKNAMMASSAALGVASDTTQAIATADVTLTVTGELGSKAISITNGDNINQIVSKINAESANTGVKASYDQLSDKLMLVSTQTGLAAKIQLDSNDVNFLDKLKLAAPGATTTGTVTGQDAIVNFNGMGDTSVRSNTFTMNNITFTLLKDPDLAGDSDYTINASITSDVDSVVNTIKGVFDKYNELIASMNSKLNEPRYRDYPPLTDTQKQDMKDSDIELWEQKAKSGLLRGDTVIQSGLDKMRRNLADIVSGIGAGQFDSLADIGITTAPSDGTNSYAYQENGKIYIDETKLRNALETSPEQVATLFTKDGARDASGRLITGQDAGIGTRLFETVNSDIIKGLTEKTQIVPTKSYLQRQIDDYTSQIAREEYDLPAYEQQLYSQYAKLEQALNQLNSQGAYLSSFFQKG